MKANPGKSHILLSNKKTEKVKIDDAVLPSSVEEKLLGITLDSKLKLEKQISYKHLQQSQSKNACSVQNYKLHLAE